MFEMTAQINTKSTMQENYINKIDIFYYDHTIMMRNDLADKKV